MGTNTGRVAGTRREAWLIVAGRVWQGHRSGVGQPRSCTRPDGTVVDEPGSVEGCTEADPPLRRAKLEHVCDLACQNHGCTRCQLLNG
jgi:hypothetical protein